MYHQYGGEPKRHYYRYTHYGLDTPPSGVHMSSHEPACPCLGCTPAAVVKKLSASQLQSKFNSDTSGLVSFQESFVLVTALYNRVIDIGFDDKAVEEITIHGGNEDTTVLLFCNRRRILNEFYLPVMPVDKLADLLSGVYEDGPWSSYDSPVCTHGSMYTCSIAKDLDEGC